MVKAICTDEGYDIYKRYNEVLHDKKDTTKDGYDSFLC